MKLFGYIRVSGKGQVDGDGPERQEESIRKFCAAQGLGSPELMFFEAGVSGTVEGLDRPEFSRMMDCFPDNESGVVVVERMDRLARDLMVSEFLLKECRQHSIVVYASDQGALIDMASNDGDPTRKLIRQVLGALAEWEKSALVKKLRTARDRIRAEKGYCEGPAPYGANEGERKIKAAIFAMQSQGISLSRIASALNHESWHTRTGKCWNRASVFQVIRGERKRTKLCVVEDSKNTK